MKHVFSLKLFLHLFVLFVIWKMNLIHLIYSCIQRIFLGSKFQELLNSEIILPQNTLQSDFLGFPDNKDNFEVINHLHLIFKYYLFKSRMQGK